MNTSYGFILGRIRNNPMIRFCDAVYDMHGRPMDETLNMMIRQGIITVHASDKGPRLTAYPAA